LHQARVAFRRFRVAMSMFKPALVDERFGRLQGELRWLVSKLGDARNLDVYLERPDLTKSDERNARRRRERAYAVAIRALGSPRYRLLMIDLVAWIAAGDWRGSKKARRPARPFIDKRIEALWDKVTRSKGTLGRMDEESRHRVRIRVKKLRYALEFAEALHQARSSDRKKFARGVQALQETLGRLNDLATARELERRFGRDSSLERPRHEKRRLVAEAGRALRTLASVGPYWRAPAERPSSRT
jgi:triphosphatase